MTGVRDGSDGINRLPWCERGYPFLLDRSEMVRRLQIDLHQPRGDGHVYSSSDDERLGPCVCHLQIGISESYEGGVQAGSSSVIGTNYVSATAERQWKCQNLLGEVLSQCLEYDPAPANSVDAARRKRRVDMRIWGLSGGNSKVEDLKVWGGETQVFDSVVVLFEVSFKFLTTMKLLE